MNIPFDFYYKIHCETCKITWKVDSLFYGTLCFKCRTQAKLIDTNAPHIALELLKLEDKKHLLYSTGFCVSRTFFKKECLKQAKYPHNFLRMFIDRAISESYALEFENEKEFWFLRQLEDDKRFMTDLMNAIIRSLEKYKKGIVEAFEKGNNEA